MGCINGGAQASSQAGELGREESLRQEGATSSLLLTSGLPRSPGMLPEEKPSQRGPGPGLGRGREGEGQGGAAGEQGRVESRRFH